MPHQNTVDNIQETHNLSKSMPFWTKREKCDDVSQNENDSPGKRLVKNPYCYCSVNESSNKEK